MDNHILISLECFCIFLLLFVQNSTFKKNLSNLFMGLCLGLDSWWFWSQVFEFRSSCLVQNFEDTPTLIKICNFWKIIKDTTNIWNQFFLMIKKKKKTISYCSPRNQCIPIICKFHGKLQLGRTHTINLAC